MSVADRLAERRDLYAFMQAGGSLEDETNNLLHKRIGAIQAHAKQCESELKEKIAEASRLEEHRTRTLTSLDPLKPAEDKLKALVSSISKFNETNIQLMSAVKNGVKDIEALQMKQQDLVSVLNKKLKHEKQFDEANAKLEQFGQTACKKMAQSGGK